MKCQQAPYCGSWVQVCVSENSLGVAAWRHSATSRARYKTRQTSDKNDINIDVTKNGGQTNCSPPISGPFSIPVGRGRAKI